MKDETPGLIAPLNPPQMEAEAGRDIRSLMLSAPAWDEMFVPELLHLARNHVALRAALGFLLEKAQVENNQLLVAETEIEVFRHQGAIRGLQSVYQTLLGQMEYLDENKEKLQ